MYRRMKKPQIKQKISNKNKQEDLYYLIFMFTLKLQ